MMILVISNAQTLELINRYRRKEATCKSNTPFLRTTMLIREFASIKYAGLMFNSQKMYDHFIRETPPFLFKVFILTRAAVKLQRGNLPRRIKNGY